MYKNTISKNSHSLAALSLSVSLSLSLSLPPPPPPHQKRPPHTCSYIDQPSDRWKNVCLCVTNPNIFEHPEWAASRFCFFFVLVGWLVGSLSCAVVYSCPLSVLKYQRPRSLPLCVMFKPFSLLCCVFFFPSTFFSLLSRLSMACLVCFLSLCMALKTPHFVVWIRSTFH
jgi:hypothetical protein